MEDNELVEMTETFLKKLKREGGENGAEVIDD